MKNMYHLRTLAVVFLLSISLIQCSKDDDAAGPVEPPKPTTRIQAVTLETQGTGIPLLNKTYVFVYMDDKNELEGVAVLNPDGSIDNVWVFLYDATGRPESATRVASDLTTIQLSLPLTYTGTTLTGMGTINLQWENNRIAQTDSTRYQYDANNNVVKTFRVRSGQPETRLSESLVNSSLKLPWYSLLPRKELQPVMPLVIPTLSIVEVLTNNALTSSRAFAPNGSVNDILYSFTDSENGYVVQVDRSVSIPGNQRRMVFTYEPIP
jgi:hypothetical protein